MIVHLACIFLNTRRRSRTDPFIPTQGTGNRHRGDIEVAGKLLERSTHFLILVFMIVKEKE